MADFCTRCSIIHFDKDCGDLSGLSSKEDTKKGLFASVICEGCGFVQVDHTGKCISSYCEVCNEQEK